MLATDKMNGNGHTQQRLKTKQRKRRCLNSKERSKECMPRLYWCMSSRFLRKRLLPGIRPLHMRNLKTGFAPAVVAPCATSPALGTCRSTSSPAGHQWFFSHCHMFLRPLFAWGVNDSQP